MEHGGGWTPDEEQKLFANLNAKGVPYLKRQDLVDMVAEMERHREKRDPLRLQWR